MHARAVGALERKCRSVGNARFHTTATKCAKNGIGQQDTRRSVILSLNWPSRRNVNKRAMAVVVYAPSFRRMIIVSSTTSFLKTLRNQGKLRLYQLVAYSWRQESVRAACLQCLTARESRNWIAKSLNVVDYNEANRTLLGRCQDVHNLRELYTDHVVGCIMGRALL